MSPEVIKKKAPVAPKAAPEAEKKAAPEHHDNHEAMDKAWNSQNDIYKEISDLGMQSLYRKRADRNKAFLSPEEIKKGGGKCVCCSDEGCRAYRSKGASADMLQERLPGSGVLGALNIDSKDPFDPGFITMVARHHLSQKITVVTSHEGCGAFTAVYNNWLKVTGKPQAEDEEVNAKAAEWAERVASKMNELKKLEPKNIPPDYPDVAADFISLKKMDRPAEFHDARILYITDIEEFNASYKGLPKGFVLMTERTENLQSVIGDANVLRGIAFGKHGFGKKFTDKKGEQFVLCFVTDREDRLTKLFTAGMEYVRGLPEDLKGRIKVETLLRDTTEAKKN